MTLPSPALPTAPLPEGSLLFIFDMDDVLYEYDGEARMAGLNSITGLAPARLRELWWHETGEFAAEAGRWTDGAGYLDAFESAIGQPIGAAEWVRVRGEAMTPWPESIAAVRRAAEFGQITLLTNNGALLGENLAQLAPDLAPLFGEHLLTSSFYGARKPEVEVFERVLERYGVAAENTFFADDLPENIAGARSLGIEAHLFTHSAGLLAAVEAFGAARGR
jgi:FMN phosphatase YigB (HAD superfamily)